MLWPDVPDESLKEVAICVDCVQYCMCCVLTVYSIVCVTSLTNLKVIKHCVDSSISMRLVAKHSAIGLWDGTSM